MDPKRVVESGYDAASIAYRSDDEPDGAYGPWLADASEGLPAGAPVLDLGCGCGVPAARWLVAHGYAVTGVDLSPVQIERARRFIPERAIPAPDDAGHTLVLATAEPAA